MNLANLGDAIITYLGIITFGIGIEGNSIFHNAIASNLFWKVGVLAMLSLLIYQAWKFKSTDKRLIMECFIVFCSLFLTLLIISNIWVINDFWIR